MALAFTMFFCVNPNVSASFAYQDKQSETVVFNTATAKFHSRAAATFSTEPSSGVPPFCRFNNDPTVLKIEASPPFPSFFHFDGQTGTLEFTQGVFSTPTKSQVFTVTIVCPLMTMVATNNLEIHYTNSSQMLPESVLSTPSPEALYWRSQSNVWALLCLFVLGSWILSLLIRLGEIVWPNSAALVESDNIDAQSPLRKVQLT